MEKLNAVKEQVNQVSSELGCSLLEAATKLQTIASANNSEEILECLCEYKGELINNLNILGEK